MPQRRTFGGLGILLVAVQLLEPFSARCQTRNDLSTKLSARVGDYRVTNENLIEALCHISRDFKIPMGITWTNTAATRQKLSMSWRDSTVREIIEGISQFQAGYRIDIRPGIVHVFSEEILPQQNFLLLKIPHFEVPHQAVEVASVGLHEVIKLAVSPSIPMCCGTGGSIAGNTDEPKLDLQFTDTSVESILDALAINSNSNIWIVTFSEKPVVTPTGVRLTESLWNDSPIPEDEQPIGDRVRWSDPLPSRLHN